MGEPNNGSRWGHLRLAEKLCHEVALVAHQPNLSQELGSHSSAGMFWFWMQHSGHQWHSKKLCQDLRKTWFATTWIEQQPALQHDYILGRTHPVSKQRKLWSLGSNTFPRFHGHVHTPINHCRWTKSWPRNFTSFQNQMAKDERAIAQLYHWAFNGAKFNLDHTAQTHVCDCSATLRRVFQPYLFDSENWTSARFAKKVGHTHTHTTLACYYFFRGGKPSTQPPPLNLQGLWGSVPAGLLELAADRGSCKEKTARCDQRCYEDAFPGISHVLKMHLFLLDYFL